MPRKGSTGITVPIKLVEELDQIAEDISAESGVTLNKRPPTIKYLIAFYRKHKKGTSS